MPEQKVMPSGSALPKKEDNAGKDEGDKGGDKLLGKFDTPEDLAKGYTELETLLNKQGTEVGDLRKQNAELSAKKEPVKEKGGEDTKSYSDREKEILENIDKGDVELAAGMAELMSLTREETTKEMETKFSAHDDKRAAQDLYDDFVEDNPLFSELKTAGKLAEVMKTNPMHDEFSAYFAVKAELDAASSFEKGQEEALKISKGADGTRRVLGDTGSQNRDAPVPKKGMSQSEQAGGMLAAIQASRAK